MPCRCFPFSQYPGKLCLYFSMGLALLRDGLLLIAILTTPRLWITRQILCIWNSFYLSLLRGGLLSDITNASRFWRNSIVFANLFLWYCHGKYPSMELGTNRVHFTIFWNLKVLLKATPFVASYKTFSANPDRIPAFRGNPNLLLHETCKKKWKIDVENMRFIILLPIRHRPEIFIDWPDEA